MLAAFLCRIAHADTHGISKSASHNLVKQSYLQLDLEQRWQIDDRNFHALLRALELDDIVEVPPKSVIQIKALVRDVQMQMREQVLLLMRGI